MNTFFRSVTRTRGFLWVPIRILLSKFSILNHCVFLALLSCILFGCTHKVEQKTDDALYPIFQNPPTEAKPFVRWWWNGNSVEKSEIDRELELLKEKGFGGVEINPVQKPPGQKSSAKSLVWMSDEWIDMVVHASKKSKDLGMITDLIVGTGWPFGGEFLEQQETCQRVVPNAILYKSGEKIEIEIERLWQLYFKDFDKKNHNRKLSKTTTRELLYIKVFPEDCSSSDQIIDLSAYVDKGKLVYTLPESGNFYLSYGFLLHSFRDVAVGAPGGAGPVMDHYDKDITYKYLSRLKKITERSGIPLSELIRALFCDSIEVSGANWTDNFADLFRDTYNYNLDAWKPFIFYPPYDGYASESYNAKFSEEFQSKLKKVRYDYNKLLVDTFLQNFTQVFHDFCEENNVLSRYQAYGTPFLMGMLDGYMIPDIPESNNWVYSSKMKDSTWNWGQGKGTMIWNMYTSAAAHLGGKKIASCESMTNTNGVFKTTLEEIKQHDDMNFITGMNHSILHGYNYSPPDVEFPGWVRFGAYFSEYNPWWKHLNKWVDYNARLSSVFQNSQPDKSIAIIGPTADVWGDFGLTRTEYHLKPKYLYKLWEPISQLGYSCEYINLKILENGTIDQGHLVYGKMKYSLLVLASLKSISPEALRKLQEYVTSGGKVVVIDQFPNSSLHLNDFQKNDALIKEEIEKLLTSHKSSFVQVQAPASTKGLFNWTQDLLTRSKVKPDMIIKNPNKNVYQLHQYTSNKELYFFTNVHRYDTAQFSANFPVGEKYPYVWDPETGERKPYYFESNASELTIELNPLQSLLLVFEDEKPDSAATKSSTSISSSKIIDVNWSVTGNRVDKKTFDWSMPELVDFSTSKDSTKASFGGEIIYKARINYDSDFTHVDLGDVNEGVTELYLNGKFVGKKWYGKAIYPIEEHIKKGLNDIEIRYTTVLANYCKSISKNNAMANWFTSGYKNSNATPTGIEGPIRLLKIE